MRFTGYSRETARLSTKPNFFCASCTKNYALDQKMNQTFFDGLDELYRHAKLGEDRTTPVVGVKMWCLFFL